jgi:hypothetical protein
MTAIGSATPHAGAETQDVHASTTCLIFEPGAS